MTEAELEQSAEHRVAMELQALSNAIMNLCKMRMSKDTADEVLSSELELHRQAIRLAFLLSDIKASNDNSDRDRGWLTFTSAVEH